MDHHPGDLLLACGWNWMISCRGWRGVTGGCAPMPEGESVYSIRSLTPAIHSCALPPSSTTVIRKHLTTSSLIYGPIWRAIFQSCWTFEMFQYMHSTALICKRDLIKMQSYVPMWSQDSSSFEYKWHWCCTSRHDVYLCVYFLVITRNVGSRGASDIWSIIILSLKRLTFDF